MRLRRVVVGMDFVRCEWRVGRKKEVSEREHGHVAQEAKEHCASERKRESAIGDDGDDGDDQDVETNSCSIRIALRVMRGALAHRWGRARAGW